MNLMKLLKLTCDLLPMKEELVNYVQMRQSMYHCESCDLFY